MMGKVWAAYFSATGTTKKVVEAITAVIGERLGMETDIFDFTLPSARTEAKEFGSEDIVIFGTPVYAGRVPNVLIKYIASFRGNGAKAVPVVLYGNRNFDDALIEFRDMLIADGFRPIAAAAFIGEHAFSYKLAAGRPDDKDMATVREFAAKTAEKLKEDYILPVYVKGESPIRPYYQPRDRHGNPVNILKVKPKTGDACTNCGICAEVCPMGSINPYNIREYTGICIKCGACVKKCPASAKYYDDEGYLYHKTELELGYERRAEPELFY